MSAGDITFDYDDRARTIAQSRRQAIQGSALSLRKEAQDSGLHGPWPLIDRTTIGVTPNDGGAPFSIKAKQIIINTGSRPRPIKGVPYDGVRVINSDHAVVLEKLPKSFLIRGGGATGVEWASVYHRYGSKTTLVGNIVPLEEPEVSEHLAKALARQKMDLASRCSADCERHRRSKATA